MPDRMADLRDRSWTLMLCELGANRCWHCGMVGSGARMVTVSGHAIHLGCILPAIRRGKI